MEQPAPAAASSPFSAARRVPETARGELSASRASNRGEGSTGGARCVRWIELTALECSENRLQRETRTFFAFVISFSISSVERLRASSTAGSFICAAAAREATRVVAAETRSPLVETSASASSTRRKSDMTDARSESSKRVEPSGTEQRGAQTRCGVSFWTPSSQGMSSQGESASSAAAVPPVLTGSYESSQVKSTTNVLCYTVVCALTLRVHPSTERTPAAGALESRINSRSLDSSRPLFNLSQTQLTSTASLVLS